MPPHSFLPSLVDILYSDFWLAASNGVSTTEDGIPTFDSNCTLSVLFKVFLSYSMSLPASSTFKDLKIPFEIQYGSGAAQGTLGQDVVQLAGFQVNSQTLGTSPRD